MFDCSYNNNNIRLYYTSLLCQVSDDNHGWFKSINILVISTDENLQFDSQHYRAWSECTIVQACLTLYCCQMLTIISISKILGIAVQPCERIMLYNETIM